MNEEQNIEKQEGDGVLPCVSGSKLERIAQTKKFFDEGRIYFDPINHVVNLTPDIVEIERRKLISFEYNFEYIPI